MGNVPWDGMGWDRHKLLWDLMGMGQINMSHGQPWLNNVIVPGSSPNKCRPGTDLPLG